MTQLGRLGRRISADSRADSGLGSHAGSNGESRADGALTDGALTDGDAAPALPLYWRMLRLRNVHPNSLQRALLFEGSLGLAALLVLADVASAWTLLVLPIAVAVVVKGHDLLVGVLMSSPSRPSRP